MKNTGQSLKQLGADLFIYPQLLINTPVKDKHAALEDAELLAAVDEVAKELGDEGRILVRPSGTEPLVRVMVEAKTDALCEKYVYRIVDFIKEKGLQDIEAEIDGKIPETSVFLYVLIPQNSQYFMGNHVNSFFFRRFSITIITR